MLFSLFSWCFFVWVTQTSAGTALSPLSSWILRELNRLFLYVCMSKKKTSYVWMNKKYTAGWWRPVSHVCYMSNNFNLLDELVYKQQSSSNFRKWAAHLTKCNATAVMHIVMACKAFRVSSLAVMQRVFVGKQSFKPLDSSERWRDYPPLHSLLHDSVSYECSHYKMYSHAFM